MLVLVYFLLRIYVAHFEHVLSDDGDFKRVLRQKIVEFGDYKV